MTTPSATPIPSSLAVDLLFNAEKIDESVNTSALTYTDRLGVQRMTLAGAIYSIAAVNPRGAWATSQTYAAKDLVYQSGTWYVCVFQHIAGATFVGDAAYWRVFQGVVAPDLINASDSGKGPGMLGFGPGVSYAWSTVGARVNRSGHPAQTNIILGGGAASDFSLSGTTGYRTTIVGVNAGAAIAGASAAGGSNCYFGYGAGAANVEGSGNIFIGALAAPLNVNGDHNNIVGYRSLDKHTNSLQNNCFGFNNCFSLTAGANNSTFGESVLYTATNVTGAALFGAFAGYSRQTGDYPVCYGYQAGFGETTAVGNTFIGKRAGFPFTTQGNNTIVGYEAGDGVAGGANNTLIGYQTAKAINGATGTVAVGWWAGLRLSTGSNNVFIGQQSGQFVTTGSDDVLIGQNAGSAVSAGTSTNTMVGSVTGQNVNGNANTFLGYAAGSTAAAQTYTNVTCLGANTVPNGSNQIVLGDTSITALRCQVTSITSLSDARFKKDIEAIPLGLKFIRDARIVRYRFIDKPADYEVGVVAQELQALQSKHSAHWMRLVDERNKDRLEATPGKLLFPLIRAVQELADEVDKLKAALAAKK